MVLDRTRETASPGQRDAATTCFDTARRAYNTEFGNPKPDRDVKKHRVYQRSCRRQIRRTRHLSRLKWTNHGHAMSRKKTRWIRRYGAETRPKKSNRKIPCPGGARPSAKMHLLHAKRFDSREWLSERTQTYRTRIGSTHQRTWFTEPLRLVPTRRLVINQKCSLRIGERPPRIPRPKAPRSSKTNPRDAVGHTRPPPPPTPGIKPRRDTHPPASHSPRGIDFTNSTARSAIRSTPPSKSSSPNIAISSSGGIPTFSYTDPSAYA